MSRSRRAARYPSGNAATARMATAVAVTALLVGALCSGCDPGAWAAPTWLPASAEPALDTTGVHCSTADSDADLAAPAAGADGGAGGGKHGRGGGSSAGGLTAHGECTVVEKPDLATLLINLVVPGATAGAADAGVTARTGAVVAALRAKGVAQQDLREGQLLVNPVISPIISAPLTGIGGARITGFSASRLLTAVVRTVGQAPAVETAVLDAATDAARVQLDYSVSDDGPDRTRAEAAAVQTAIQSAHEMADASGVTLGQLLSLAEVAPATGTLAPGAGSGESALAGPAPVRSDGQELSAAVDVTFAVG